MKILGIDTSSSSLSVAVTDDSFLKAEITINHKLTHSKQLMPEIDRLLKSLNMKIKDIDLIGVCIGPGSFTGIRIGVATANAMAMGLDIPVIGISSMQAMAYSFYGTEKTVAATLDAQRDRVYAAFYRFEKDKMITLRADDVLEIDELKAKMESFDNPVLCGDALFMMDEIPKNIIKANRANTYIRGSSVCELAEMIYKNDNDRPQFAEPVYLRKSQAELQFDEKMKKEKADQI